MVRQLFKPIRGIHILKMGVTTDIIKVSIETLRERLTHLVFCGFLYQVSIVLSAKT